jgi:phasin family protein
LTLIVQCTIERTPGLSRISRSAWEGSVVVKVEDIQQYGKEHLESVVASAHTVQGGMQAIATAYGEYAKKSFEDGKSFVEQLAGVKSLDKAIEVQTEYAKAAYETFVAESRKIAELYGDLARQSAKPFEGLVTKFSPAAAR